MDSPRHKAYVWVTWLRDFLVGKGKCKWKFWYKSKFRYAKKIMKKNYDLEQWTKDHNAMTNIRVKVLKEAGRNPLK